MLKNCRDRKRLSPETASKLMEPEGNAREEDLDGRDRL